MNVFFGLVWIYPDGYSLIRLVADSSIVFDRGNDRQRRTAHEGDRGEVTVTQRQWEKLRRDRIFNFSNKKRGGGGNKANLRILTDTHWRPLTDRPLSVYRSVVPGHSSSPDRPYSVRCTHSVQFRDWLETCSSALVGFNVSRTLVPWEGFDLRSKD